MGQPLTISSVLLEDAQYLYPHLGSNPVVFINANFILVTLGQISLIFLIGTLLFSPYVKKRNITLINLLALTIFVSIPPALLYYSGHILDPDPPFGLCLTQATLNYGSSPMFIVASLALVIELLVETRFVTIRIRRRYSTGLLVALPYLVFIVFAIWTAALGGSHPQAVKHQVNQLYCTISYSAFGRGIDAFCAITAVLTVSLVIYTHVKYRRIWKNVGYDGPTQGFSARPVLRLLGFTCLQLFYLLLLALDLLVGNVATHTIPIAYEALMPLATFFIFGTSMDCLTTWKFWDRGAARARMLRRRQRYDASDDASAGPEVSEV